MIAMVKTERTLQTILSGMGLPTRPSKVFANPSPVVANEELEWGGEDEPRVWAD
jgi:hypothetical protein